MRKLILAASFSWMLLSPAAAEERKLTGTEIETALTDHTFKGNDRGHETQQIFQAGGGTFYSEDGNQSQGFWRVTGDQYCSKWPPSDSWGCYDVMVDGEVLTFVSGTGTRYPVKRVN